MSYLMRGQIDRARDFIRLDAGSEWAAFMNSVAAMRSGKREEGLESAKLISGNSRLLGNLVQACLAGTPPPELERVGREAEPVVMAEADPERRFSFGEVLYFCNQKDAGLRAIQSAIRGNYCAYDALQHDPMLAKLRGMHEYGALLNQAKACQNGFLAARNRERP